MVTVMVSFVSLGFFLFVEAYMAIVLTVHASGMGVPRSGSSPLEVTVYDVKKLPGPVHHVRALTGVTPVTRNVGSLVPGGPGSPAAPVAPVGPTGPCGPVNPVAPVGPGAP